MAWVASDCKRSAVERHAGTSQKLKQRAPPATAAPKRSGGADELSARHPAGPQRDDFAVRGEPPECDDRAQQEGDGQGIGQEPRQAQQEHERHGARGEALLDDQVRHLEHELDQEEERIDHQAHEEWAHHPPEGRTGQ